MVDIDGMNKINFWVDPPDAAQTGRSDRVYMDFFNLKGVPFSITPDPEFLFLSESHQSVLEKIHYGIQSRMGFMLLTGEVGTGKTTLCRVLLEQLRDCARTVYVINPSLSGREILACILEDLGLTCSAGASKKDLIDQLNALLLAHESAVPVVIIIDDAQTMPPETLEDLRLLSNLETEKSKLLQILVVGQPELLDQLDRPELRQLRQRVAVHCRLAYLSCNEVGGYIERRLFIAGNQGRIRFTPKTVKQIHRKTNGIPRMINKICDLSLTAAYTTSSFIIDTRHLKTACCELIDLKQTGRHESKPGVLNRRPFKWLAATIGLGLSMSIGFSAYPLFSHTTVIKPEMKQIQPVIQSTVLNTTLSDKSEVSSLLHSALPQAAGAYILQLGSYNTLVTTLRAIDIYAQKGLKTHWNPVDLVEKGVWYRVFTGRYPTIEAARQYQKTEGLPDAQVVYAAWAVSLGLAEGAAELKAILNAGRVDCYAASDKDGRLHLISGAFVSRERAQAMAEHITKTTGLATDVVDLDQPVVPFKVSVPQTQDGDPS